MITSVYSLDAEHLSSYDWRAGGAVAAAVSELRGVGLGGFLGGRGAHLRGVRRVQWRVHGVDVDRTRRLGGPWAGRVDRCRALSFEIEQAARLMLLHKLKRYLISIG